jgi:hypothetical protein
MIKNYRYLQSNFLAVHVKLDTISNRTVLALYKTQGSTARAIDMQ